MNNEKVQCKKILIVVILLVLMSFVFYLTYNFNIKLVLYKESSSVEDNVISVYRQGESFLSRDNDMKLYLNEKKVMDFYMISDPLEGVDCNIKWVNDKNALVVFYNDCGAFVIDITFENEKSTIYYYTVENSTQWDAIEYAKKYKQSYDHKIKVNKNHAVVDQKKIDELPDR